MHLIRAIPSGIVNQQAAHEVQQGTPDLYPLHKAPSENSLPILTIRPRFVGRAARPRAATLPTIDVHHYASGKAGGRCAPRLVTAVLGLAARGRPAAPDAVA